MWDFLAGCSLVAPFFMVPVFVVGAAGIQDYLITGDGQSWRRATLWFGVPTGAITIVVLIAAIRAVALGLPPRGAAIFAVVANALALGLILYGIVTASAAWPP
jgi:hypothetical protein